LDSPWFSWSWLEGGGRLSREVARTGTGQLVGVDEESSVWITRVHREHSVVDILLCALGLVAGGEKTTGRVREETGLKTGGLGVVVVTIAVSLRDMLEDDSPVSLNIDSTGDLGIVNIRRTKVSLRSNPVRSIIWRWALGCSSVVLVVKRLLLKLGNVLNKIISRLISNIGVLFQEQSVLRDLVGDIISWILLVHNTIRKVGTFGTLWWSFRVTISMMCWGRAIGGRVDRGVRGGVDRGVRGGVDSSMRTGSPDDCRDDEETCNLE